MLARALANSTIVSDLKARISEQLHEVAKIGVSGGDLDIIALQVVTETADPAGFSTPSVPLSHH